MMSCVRLNGWINCTKLPKAGKSVLVLTSNRHPSGHRYFIAYRSATEEWFHRDRSRDGSRVLSDITHWIPLPEAPRLRKSFRYIIMAFFSGIAYEVGHWFWRHR